MTIRRRDFLTLAGAATLSGSLPRLSAQAADNNAGVYDLERFGNARILHITDTHAQLRPVFFREPSVNLGVGSMRGNPPHLVARAFLDRFGIRPDSADAYAFTCIEFEKAAGRFGKLGGFAHLKTLVDRMRSEAGARARAAARRRRSLAGHRPFQHAAGRRHGGCGQPARHRGDDRPLGIHLWREGAARQPRTLQGRIPGAERFPHRGSRLQRRQGVRSGLGARVQAVRHQGDRRVSHRRDRAGIPLRADRAPEAFYAGLEIRHPRRGTAKARRYPSQHRQGRCRHSALA